MKEKKQESVLFGHRLEIRVDDKLRLGTSIPVDPQNDKELVGILKEIIVAIEAPRIEDPEMF